VIQTSINFDAPPRFDGPDAHDVDRLGSQLASIFAVIRDGRWYTPEELEAATGYRWASISAQLRHLRKARFGSHRIDKESLGNGLYRYRMVS
jgi:hypothetical protein